MVLRARAFRFGCALFAAAPVFAEAQTPAKPADTAPKSAAPKETVTVQAIKPEVQVLPDRTVYSLDKNLQSATGSLSDALRTLPSVNVDIDGNVSLRGDSNVTILVDGKESPLLAGDRASALQRIPANLVDRIEVITNPSAEFRAEGSAGIINIVLKKEVEMKSSGVVRLNVGDKGRVNLNASGNIKFGKVNLNGGYGERRDRGKFLSSTVRSGNGTDSAQNVTNTNIYSGRYVWLAASLPLSEQDEIEFSSNYFRFGGNGNSHEHNIVPGVSDATRDGLAHWQNAGAGQQGSYTHNFATKGEKFDLEASHFTMWNRNGTEFDSVDTVSGAPENWQSRRSAGRTDNIELKADYTDPLPHQGQIKTGYALQINHLGTDNHGLTRDATMTAWVDDPTFTNNFVLDRTVHAGYVSYTQKFGRFGVMGGLRLEQDFLTTNLITTGEVHDTDTLGFYPSVHLSYDLTDLQQLKLSYSRRMNRPGPGALNPARYSSDAFNVWAGNPYLKPEQVDSFELSYRLTGEKYDLVTTGYYRATYKGITSVYRYIAPTVLLTTLDNLARRMDSGVEANFNATLMEGLSLRTNGMLAYSEFNPGPAAVGSKQSGLNWNIRGGLDWQATPDDLFQFNAQYSGKQRVPQGYYKPTYSGDFGYKHNFDGGISAVVSVNNLFDSRLHDGVLDAPGVHQTTHGVQPGRVYYIGLVYTFGGFKDNQRITDDNGGGAGAGANPGGGGGP
jgi:outer membrane receptor protein involved in Fe transport